MANPFLHSSVLIIVLKASIMGGDCHQVTQLIQQIILSQLRRLPSMPSFPRVSIVVEQ